MSMYWLVVRTTDHNYSVLSSEDVKEGRIACSSSIITTQNGFATVVFVDSCRNRCDQYCERLTDSSGSQQTDVEGTSMCIMSQDAGQAITKNTSEWVGFSLRDAEVSVKDSFPQKPVKERSTCHPHLLVVELKQTVRALEEEFRSRFRQLENRIEETQTRIISIKEMVELRQPKTHRTGDIVITDEDHNCCQSPSSSLKENHHELLSDENSTMEKDDSSISASDLDFDLSTVCGPQSDVRSIPSGIDEVACLGDLGMSRPRTADHSEDINLSRRSGTNHFCQKPVTPPLSMQERVEVVLLTGDRKHREVAEEFNRRHPDRPISRSCVSRIIAKLKETGSISDKPRSGRPKKLASDDAVATIVDYFHRNPNMSVRQIATATGMSRSSIHRILQSYKDTKC